MSFKIDFPNAFHLEMKSPNSSLQQVNFYGVGNTPILTTVFDLNGLDNNHNIASAITLQNFTLIQNEYGPTSTATTYTIIIDLCNGFIVLQIVPTGSTMSIVTLSATILNASQIETYQPVAPLTDGIQTGSKQICIPGAKKPSIPSTMTQNRICRNKYRRKSCCFKNINSIRIGTM